MPAEYTKSGGEGHIYQVPTYSEAADGPKAFKDFADFLDLMLPPVGSIMPYAGTTSPNSARWLICDGSSYSTTAYPRLAAICGTKFGTAATGLFKVPDLRGRAVFGLDSSQTEFDTIGKTGGAKTITLTASNVPSHTHDVPAHSHTISGPTVTGVADAAHSHGVGTLAVQTGGTHTHNYTDQVHVVQTIFDRTGGGSGAVNQYVTNNKTTGSTGSGHSHTLSGSTASDGQGHVHNLNLNLATIGGGSTVTAQNSGGGQPVTAISPYLTLNHIIRAA